MGIQVIVEIALLEKSLNALRDLHMDKGKRASMTFLLEQQLTDMYGSGDELHALLLTEDSNGLALAAHVVETQVRDGMRVG